MPLQPGARLGPYEIVDLLGEGGMGRVYRARDRQLNRDVAIKRRQASARAHRRWSHHRRCLDRAGHVLMALPGYNIGASVGVSRDGRWITYTETATEGDIWIATIKK